MKILHFAVTVAFFVFNNSCSYNCVASSHAANLHVLMILPNCCERSNVTEDAIRIIGVCSNNEYEILVKLISRIIGWYNSKASCDEIIGVVGDIDTCTANIIHTLASRSNLSIAMVATSKPSTFPPLIANTNVLDLNPLQHYLDALVGLIQHQKWSQIRLISEEVPYYRYAAEKLQMQLKEEGNSIESLTPHFGIHGARLALRTIRECSSTDVILIFMSEPSVCLLLEEAERVHHILRSYTWIVVDFESNFNQSSGSCVSDGLIMVTDHHMQGNYTDVGRKLNLQFDNNYAASSFRPSRVLYDSISAAVTSAELGTGFSNGSFVGSTGLQRFKNGNRLSNISISKITNKTAIKVASYNSESRLLKFLTNESVTTSAKRSGGNIIFIEGSTAHILTVATFTTLSFTFVTVMLVLYVCFHHHPEIKATSITVSFCMFAGCYIPILHVFLLLIAYEPAMDVALPADVTCNGLAWSSGIGLPPALILSTLLVKMLRVYSVFKDPFAHKRRYFRNSFLLLYIALLTSPTFITLTLWSIVDPLMNHEIMLADDCGHVLVLEACLGTRPITWIMLLLLYVAILITCVTVLALKSSKIRYKNFQDTKATNAFAFLSISLTIMTTLYWYFFYRLEPSVVNFRATYITLYCGNNVIPVVCQLFLFVPKILPPIRRLSAAPRYLPCFL